MRVYLSGPMTGIPDYNYPAFHGAAVQLRAAGFEVVSPAEKPTAADAPWPVHMRQDIQLMMACDGVVLLRGWEGSRGAKIERRLALDVGMPVAELETVLQFQACGMCELCRVAMFGEGAKLSGGAVQAAAVMENQEAICGSRM